MPRVHLFEFEDQPWFPEFLRDYLTDFLQFISNRAKIYKPAVSILEKGLAKSKSNQIIDLGSGGGGGLLWLSSEMGRQNPNLKITMTDYYPNIDAFEYTKRRADNIDYISTPVDARSVPSNLKGFRTQFLSFHHFAPDDARQILQNAVDTESGIAIVEAQERSLLSLIGVLLSPITVLVMTPFIEPFNIGRIVFTYFIPVVPLVALWDGVVSSLRTYSVAEMHTLVNIVNGSEKYDWEIGRKRAGPGVILYLLGTKK